jgi:hypothetical protein
LTEAGKVLSGKEIRSVFSGKTLEGEGIRNLQRRYLAFIPTNHKGEIMTKKKTATSTVQRILLLVLILSFALPSYSYGFTFR